MMRFDNPNVHPSDKTYVQGFAITYEAGYLPIYAEALRQFIREQQLPSADIYSLWERMEKEEIDIHSRLSNGLNHPDRAFHAEIAAELEKVLFGIHSA